MRWRRPPHRETRANDTAGATPARSVLDTLDRHHAISYRRRRGRGRRSASKKTIVPKRSRLSAFGVEVSVCRGAYALATRTPSVPTSTTAVQSNGQAVQPLEFRDSDFLLRAARSFAAARRARRRADTPRRSRERRSRFASHAPPSAPRAGTPSRGESHPARCRTRSSRGRAAPPSCLPPSFPS